MVLNFRTIPVLWVALGGVAAAQAPASQLSASAPTGREVAALHFDRGSRLYEAGRFGEAIKAFEKAHDKAPHALTLFSIARCHENLGDLKRAITFYEQALGLSANDKRRADIRQRIKRLETRPVKVFVSSRPAGAEVTADGRANAEPKATPTVVSLSPGEHVLVLRLAGHHLTARRVVVKAGSELTVDVKLARLPKVAKKKALADWSGLRWHVGVMGSFALESGRPIRGGPGIRGYATYNNFIFGAFVRALSMPIQTLPKGATYQGGQYEGQPIEKINLLFVTAQAEVGYRLPLGSAYLWGSIGLGLGYEKVVFSGRGAGADESGAGAEENTESDDKYHSPGFAWSIGGGAGVMANDWFSVGASGRFGVYRATYMSLDAPGDSEGNKAIMYAMVSIYAMFHP